MDKTSETQVHSEKQIGPYKLILNRGSASIIILHKAPHETSWTEVMDAEFLGFFRAETTFSFMETVEDVVFQIKSDAYISKLFENSSQKWVD